MFSLAQAAYASNKVYNQDECVYVEYQTGVAWEQVYSYTSCPVGEKMNDRVYGGWGISGNWGQAGTRKFWVVRDSEVKIGWPSGGTKDVVIKAAGPALEISCGGSNIHERYCNHKNLDKLPQGVSFPFGVQR